MSLSKVCFPFMMFQLEFCLIPELLVRVLFDTEASSSFISSDLVDRLELEPEIVDRPLVVTNPIGGLTSLCRICRNLVLSSHGCMFVVIALF